VDNGLFREGRLPVADLRTVVGDIIAVEPGLEDRFDRVHVVRVALKVIHDEIVADRESPDVACGDGPVLGDFVHSPEVDRIPRERRREIVCRFGLAAPVDPGGLRRRGLHRRLVGSEVDIMLGRPIAGRPAQRPVIPEIDHLADGRTRIPGQRQIAAHGVHDLDLRQHAVVRTDLVDQTCEIP